MPEIPELSSGWMINSCKSSPITYSSSYVKPWFCLFVLLLPIVLGTGKLSSLLHSLGSEKLAVVGSPFWMAPEVLRDEPYNEKVSLKISRPDYPVAQVRISILPTKYRASISLLLTEYG